MEVEVGVVRAERLVPNPELLVHLLEVDERVSFGELFTLQVHFFWNRARGLPAAVVTATGACPRCPGRENSRPRLLTSAPACAPSRERAFLLGRLFFLLESSLP